MNRFAGIDPRQPLAALGVEGITDVRPVTGGMDTVIWRVETSQGAYALRLFQPRQRNQCEDEVRAMGIVGALGVPVPKVRSHGLWEDRPVMLMEWCEGRNVFDAVLARPELIEPLGASMGRLQARLHGVPVPREHWEDHRTWLNKAGPDEEELKARLRATGLRDGGLLHLDFHPLNVMALGDEATVVLDWANATVGDPRADVARTMSIFRLVSPPPPVPLSGFEAVRVGLERAWRAGYTEVAGPLPDMTLFEIWAHVYFIRDMETKIGMPDFWMEPADFDRLRDRVAELKRRAGFTFD